MSQLPTLRRELIIAFALVFASALMIAVIGVAIMLPRVRTPEEALLYVLLLVVADLAIFAAFGRWVLQRSVLRPVERMIEAAEGIAQGDYGMRVPPGESQEVARLGAAVNHMTERLISHQRELSANIRSLDETNRMLTEARDAMVRAEKMASVGRLGAGIAHEVGNPLGAILGYLGLLARHADEPRLELITAAEREARRIDRIVRGLLDYARPGTGETSEIDVNALIRETLDLVATQGRFENVQLDVQLDPDISPVNGAHHQLQQVLVNLLVNATDAMSGTAEPVIVIRTCERPVILNEHMPARRKGDPPGIDYSHRRRLVSGRMPREDPFSASGRVVELTVADNGPGIPPELREQIFEPFVTTKEPGKGTGLGLAVSARLIETMGGAIRADAADDGGALFTILLPALVPEAADEA